MLTSHLPLHPDAPQHIFTTIVRTILLTTISLPMQTLAGNLLTPINGSLPITPLNFPVNGHPVSLDRISFWLCPPMFFINLYLQLPLLNAHTPLPLLLHLNPRIALNKCTTVFLLTSPKLQFGKCLARLTMIPYVCSH